MAPTQMSAGTEEEKNRSSSADISTGSLPPCMLPGAVFSCRSGTLLDPRTPHLLNRGGGGTCGSDAEQELVAAHASPDARGSWLPAV